MIQFKVFSILLVFATPEILLKEWPIPLPWPNMMTEKYTEKEHRKTNKQAGKENDKKSLESLIQVRSKLIPKIKEIFNSQTCLQTMNNGTVIFSENGLPFDGQTKKQVAWINLLNTRTYSEKEFTQLLVHEVVHLGHSQRPEPELWGLRALYEEGVANLAVQAVYPEFEIQKHLGWKHSPTSNHLKKVCSLTWDRDFFNDHLLTLFSPELPFLKKFPRFGYWLGFELVQKIRSASRWCEISFSDFLLHFNKNIQKIKQSLCQKERP